MCVIKGLILFLIKCIEFIEYYKLGLRENDIDKKILNSLTLFDYYIEGDEGFKPINQIHITQPYDIYELELSDGIKLSCADNHMVFTTNKCTKYVGDLLKGELIHTKFGLSQVKNVKKTKYKSSMFDVSVNSDTHRYYANDVLSHNTITTAIFITWYLLFHSERNILIIAHKAATSSEIIDKVRDIIKRLPFFMKPGMLVDNQMNMKLDNGCKVYGSSTTKTSAIGMVFHVVYMDEFAHVQSNFIDSFYRSVYPTISSSKISKLIITSTPNGVNKFYDLWVGAIEGKNEYVPVRVDWWDVEGRDDDWKQKQILNLGSEELFNQEFGNQFLSSTRLLLSADVLKVLKKNLLTYVWKEIEIFDDNNIVYDNFKWHPNFNVYNIDYSTSRFLISVDIGDGVGNDFSIINVFKIIVNSVDMIKNKTDYKTISDFFSLYQVGIYRSNVVDVDNLSKILELLIFNVFDYDNVKVVIEVNYKGDNVLKYLQNNNNYYDDILISSYHTINSKYKKPGIKYTKESKPTRCLNLRKLMKLYKIITTESLTFQELSSFGLNSKNSYSSQTGHDDIAMSIVNLTEVFESGNFDEFVEEIYDNIDAKYRSEIDIKIENIYDDNSDKNINFLDIMNILN